MANLSRTLFGRLYGLRMNSHFYNNSRHQSLLNGTYQEKFKMGSHSLISGELYYKYVPYGDDYKDKQYFENSFIVISIDGTNQKYVEKRKQEYNGTDVIFEHEIFLYKNLSKNLRKNYNKNNVDYERITFEQIPKSLIKILDKKNDSHITKCSCHSQNFTNYLFRY